MRREIDLSPYFGEGVDLDTGQERWDALPHRTRLRYALAILEVFAAARAEEATGKRRPAQLIGSVLHQEPTDEEAEQEELFNLLEKASKMKDTIGPRT